MPVVASDIAPDPENDSPAHPILCPVLDSAWFSSRASGPRDDVTLLRPHADDGSEIVFTELASALSRISTTPVMYPRAGKC